MTDEELAQLADEIGELKNQIAVLQSIYNVARKLALETKQPALTGKDWRVRIDPPWTEEFTDYAAIHRAFGRLEMIRFGFLKERVRPAHLYVWPVRTCAEDRREQIEMFRTLIGTETPDNG